MLMTSTAFVGSAAIAETDPVGTAFTGQGRLTEAGEPVSEPADLVFRLFSQATDGALLSVLVADDLEVRDDRRFTTDLDFGDEFTGAQHAAAVEQCVARAHGVSTRIAASTPPLNPFVQGTCIVPSRSSGWNFDFICRVRRRLAGSDGDPMAGFDIRRSNRSISDLRSAQPFLYRPVCRK